MPEVHQLLRRVNPGSRRLRRVMPALRRVPPAMRGKARLARLLLGPSLHERDVLVHAQGDSVFAVPCLSEPVGFYLAVDGVYEAEEVGFALSHLRPGGVFVDVGANIGQYTIPAARKVGPNGCVEGFEWEVFAGAEQLLRGQQPPAILFEFCDWAEARRANGGPGDAQRLLRTWGYRVWRLRDRLRQRGPIEDALTEGFEALLAVRD